MGIMGGSEETPQSAVRSYGIRVPPNRALDMNESSHLISVYILNSEYKGFINLEVKGWL